MSHLDRDEESARLAALHRLSVLDTSREAAFDRITGIASRIFRVPTALISFIDADRVWIKSAHGLELNEVSRRAAFSPHLGVGDILIVPDTDDDARFRDHGWVVGPPHFRFYACAALRTEDGQLLGSLGIFDTKPRRDFGPEDRENLRDLALLVMDEIALRREVRERAAAEADLRAHAERLVVAEGVLRDSVQRFQDYANSASDWFWETDAGLRFTYLSERATDVFGLSPDAYVGRSVEDMTGKGSDAAARQSLALDLDRRRPFRDFGFVHHRPDGETRYFQISGSPVYGPDGVFRGYRGSGSDVTEQHRALEAMRESQARAALAEQLLADAIESLPEGFVLYDSERRFVTCNSRYRDMYAAVAHLFVPGASFEELMQAYLESNPPLKVDDLQAYIEARFNPHDGSPYQEQRLSDGRWVRVSDHRTRNGGIVGIRTDITVMKQQQEELHRREQQLTRAQEIARLGDWRVVWNTGQVEWSNNTFAIMGGEPRPLTLSAMMALIHPEDRPIWNVAMQRLQQTGAPQSTEFRVVGFDGVERTFWAEARLELSESGQPEAAYGVCQDITERKMVEDRLRAAKEEAEAASRAKSQFLASMSHELRTPLNAVIGFSDIISYEMLGAIGNPKYVEYAQDINRSGCHLLALIEDILDMAKVEAGRFELREVEVDVAGLVDMVLRLAEAADPVGQHRFETAIDDPSLVLWADARALKQILLNLVTNATKFTPEGGTIGVRVTSDPEGVTMTVEDDGIGIPPNRLSDLGQPFVQVENVMTRRHFGSGIGLYISRSLAELHGGRLDIESEVGAGTRIHVTLPRSRVLAGPTCLDAKAS